MAVNLSSNQQPEVVGYDYGQLIAPALQFTNTIIDKFGGGSKQAPPAPVPLPSWVLPVSIGGGALLLITVIITSRK